MAGNNGEEKLLAVARHIAKTLGHNDSMADDILQIFSNFDDRFSRENLSEEMVVGGGGGGGVDRREVHEHGNSRAVLEHTLNTLDRQILQYVTADHSIWTDLTDSATFLDVIDELVATIRDWSPMNGENSVAACLVRAEDLLQQAMFRLEDELRLLMERGGEALELNRGFGNSESTGNRYSFDSEEEDEDRDGFIGAGDDDEIPVAHPITDYNIVIDALPPGTINDLHEIAKRMVAAGYTKECSHVYSSCRRDFLEESISRLGLPKLTIEEVSKMPWSELEDQIERWIKAMNVAVRILFPSERRLCDRVFFGFVSAADLSFMEVCRGSMVQLLSFADAIAIGSRAPERLFKVLDVFETLRDLMPEFETMFSDQYSTSLTNEAVTIWKRLGETIRGILIELENSISRDPAKSSVPGGGLHPITRYVMNYLRAACRSLETLEQIYQEGADIRKREGRTGPSSTSLSVQVDWIMELLESNLEAKAKLYRDPALCAVFMMNNGSYIVQKVKDSELGSLLGDDWIRKHSGKLRQHQMNYQRSSWNKVLAALKLDNSTSAANISSKTMKERLKLFNNYFEETWRIQSTWVIFDEQVREELRISVSRTLLPAYRNFIGTFQSLPDVGRNADKFIQFSVEDVEARVNNLFRSSGSAGGRK